MTEVSTISKSLVIITLVNIISTLCGADLGRISQRQDEEIQSLVQPPPEGNLEDDDLLQVNEGDLGIVMKNGMPDPTNKERLDEMEYRLEKLYGKIGHEGNMEANMMEIEKEYNELEKAVKQQNGKKNGEKFHVSEKLRKFLIETGSHLPTLQTMPTRLKKTNHNKFWIQKIS